MPAIAPRPEPDSLRHRLTCMALGVDNQFSGKMIQAATGRTTSGAPINLDETTYDRSTAGWALQVGVGYRITPRTEAVVNFVYSKRRRHSRRPRSARRAPARRCAERQLHRVPVLGFEGGQRWFFARTRFTPFVAGSSA